MTFRDRMGAIPLPSPEILLGLAPLSWGWNHPRLPRSSTPNPAFDEIVRQDPCSWCAGEGGTVEHVKPRGAGGSNTWDNKAGACWHCNHERGKATILQYLAKRARLPQRKAEPRLGRTIQLMAQQQAARKSLEKRAPILGTRSRRRLPTCW